MLFPEMLKNLSYEELVLLYRNTTAFYGRYPKQTNFEYVDDVHNEIKRRLEAHQ